MSRHSHLQFTFGVVLAASTLLLATGCASGPRVHDMHAVWVTRFDYKTPEDVTTILGNSRQAGFNAVLFQVRGNGTAFYESQYEPWAEQFKFEHPGFDPLRLACEQAHADGLELHAWVNVLPAWRGTEPPPANIAQLYHTHPEWFWYDQHGDRQQLTTFYVSLNPCLPEVRAYIVDVFRDIATRYPIDGLHLDYIRFPNEPPATPRGSGIDYPRDARTLELYRAATGLAPDDDRASWDAWRTAQVTQLVADIRAMLRAVRPEIVLTSAAGSVRANALRHFQDAQLWMEQGYIDGVVLMNYTDDPATFAARLEPWLAIKSNTAIIPGMWFGRPGDRTTEEVAEDGREQIQIALEKTGNYCVFAYSSLFDSTDDELTNQSTAEQGKRAVRREIVLPYLQQVAKQTH